MDLAPLSDEELLSGVHALVGQGGAVLARLLAYLGEVEERRLDLQSACSSLFDFCLRRLGMSDDEACRRVAAARIVRRFPVALGMLERGEIHLTGLLLLRDHLTPDGGADLLRAASGKSKSELQHLLAQLFPRLDVPSRIQSLTVSATGSAQSMVGLPGTPEAKIPEPLSRPSRIEPLAPARYRVEFTATTELKQKLGRAANLMRHTHPSGDISVVVERAIDVLLAQLEKQRLAKVIRPRRRTVSLPAAPQPTVISTRPGYVPRAVRRAIFERDGERCTFVDPSGRRCESRTLLELDHRVPRARGGRDDASNLSVRCRAHNLLSAEQHFGREHIERKKGARSRCGARATGDHERAEARLGEPPVDGTPAVSVHPRQRRQRGYDEHEIAVRALCTMGFKAHEARGAVSAVGRRRSSPPGSIADLLREALTLLAWLEVPLAVDRGLPALPGLVDTHGSRRRRPSRLARARRVDSLTRPGTHRFAWAASGPAKATRAASYRRPGRGGSVFLRRGFAHHRLRRSSSWIESADPSESARTS